MGGKGLRINKGKTTVLISETGLNLLQKPGKDPCAMCPKGVCTNSIFCGGCSSWVHKKCSGIPGPLKPVSSRCKQCTGQAGPIGGRPMTEITVGREKLELVPSFCYCYLGLGGWGKLNDLLTILTSCLFPLTSRGRVYNSFVRNDMLHTSETLPNFHSLQRNDWALVHWMCGVTTKDQLTR